MKNIVKIFLASACLVGLATSCTDLQKDPTSTPSQSIYWKKKADFQSALAGCYSVVYNWPGVMSQIIACYDNLTDNSICHYDEGTYGSSKTMALGDITPQTGGFVSYVYDHCYQGIARVHILMSNLESYAGSDFSAAEKQQMMAECKALRGYFYYWLYSCYREVPVVTETLTMENMYKEKNTREEVYAQIMKDFDDAIDELPDKPYSDASVSGHITAGAIKVLKARMLLSAAYDDNGQAKDTEKLKQVVSLMKSVSGYSLAPRMRDNFLTEKQLSSPEIMFSVRYLRPNLCNKMDLYYLAWSTIEVTRDLVNEFECTDGLKWGESPLTIPVDESIINDATSEAAYAEREKLFKNRDRRMAETVFQGRTPIYPDEGFENITYRTDGSETNFTMVKLVNPSKEQIGYSTVSDADVIIVRYAEALLSMAEAENEVNGPTQTVYDAVNQVRARSAMPALPAGLSKEEMRERIRHEWRVEFAFEGQRYFQLKRWKLMEKLVNGAVDPAILTYKKVFKPAFYYFPIPQTEIDKAGGVLTQDPNYK